MKYISIVVGIILGLLFAAASVPVLIGMEMPPPPWKEGTPPMLFMGAMGPTGYMTFIKVLELIGGVLVAIPRTRNIGLLILGPIIVNIVAFHIFLGGPQGLIHPLVIIPVLAALYLLWVERKAWAGLVHRQPS
jgi:putative oxidoreductase